ncbi:MAG: 6-bladed beta-propeller [Lentimicrobiaceae bacterium]|nr:6-bladed beta-propeller [Lentimicrobiaceae bacterium]
MRKIIKIFSIATAAFVLLHCSDNKVRETSKNILASPSITKSHFANLQQTEHKIGKIKSFDVIDSTNLVVSSVNPASIIIYNFEGKPIRTIGRTGKGPFEYLSPSIVKSFKSRLYVWCDQSLKLIIFDVEGNPIEEVKGLTSAIKSFEIVDDNIFFFNHGNHKYIISIFNLSSRKNIINLGSGSEEHKLLSLAPCAGGITTMNDTIYFITADDLTVCGINKKDFKLEKWKVEDKSFKVKPTKSNAEFTINENREAAVEYLLENPRITGLMHYHNRLLVKLEMGKYVKKEGRIDFTERFIYYCLINHKKGTIQSYSCRIDSDLMLEYPCLLSTHKGNVYTIEPVQHKSDIEYALYKLDFN